MKATVTDRLLRALVAQGKPHAPIRDQVLRGFTARFGATGNVTFYVIGRRRGGSRQPLTLRVGRYPEIPLAQARERGRALLRDLHDGVDPRQREAERLRAEEAKRQHLYRDVAEDFIRGHLASKRSGQAIALRVRRELVARWGDRPIAELARSDVVRMVDAILDRGHPEAARTTLKYGRRLHDWAIARGTYGIEFSPFDRLAARDLIGAPKPRQRILAESELRLIWCAAETVAFGPYIRLLLLLGVRRTELARATWDEIDLDRALWVIPPERTKSDAAFAVSLPAAAVGILRQLPRWASSYVFSARGARPLNDFALLKTQLDRRIADLNGGEPIAAWTLHDCRRTFRTALSSIGIAQHVAELCIGHRQQGLARIYDLHRFDVEKRHALEQHAARLMRIVASADDDRIVPLRAAAH
jgi:integrase